MNYFLKVCTVAAFSTLAPMAASAAVLDFEQAFASASPITSYSEDGFTFDVSFTARDGNRGTRSTGAALFSTLCDFRVNCGGDEDLVPFSQGDDGVAGNILIRQERGATVPDDATSAGSITFTLVSGSAFRLLGFSAIDDGTFSLSTAADGNLGGLTLGERQTGRLLFDTPSSVIGLNQSFTFNFSGSGGFDAVSVSAVPVPAALPLLLAGLGGLGLMKRRQKKAAQA